MAKPIALKKGQCIKGTRYDRKIGNRDESGVPTAPLVEFLTSLPDLPERHVLSAQSGIVTSMLYRIFNAEQKVVSLGVADRLLMAMGESVSALVEKGVLTVVPLRYRDDALAMAVYEHLDDDDKLTVTWDSILERADDLMADLKAL
jgi:hypothetical protein